MDSSIIYRFFFVFLIFISPVKAIEFKGKFLQGHFILGKTDPSSKILVGKKKVKVSNDGFFVFGIDRDQKYDLIFTKIVNGKKSITTKKVLKRKYNIQRIDGLAENKVTPPESVYKRIKKENNAIGEARAINSDLQFFKRTSCQVHKLACIWERRLIQENMKVCGELLNSRNSKVKS